MAHLPARTPYARKLRSRDIAIVNGTFGLTGGAVVPIDLSFAWLARQEDYDFFDVLHIHSIELATAHDLLRVLDRCAAADKQLVATIHDIEPMFPGVDDGSYATRLEQLTAREVPLATLTKGAAAQLRELLGVPVTVLPHGYVLHPDDPRFGSAGSEGSGTVFAMYGGFRPNRSMYPVIVNFLFGTVTDAQLRILTRALSAADFEHSADARGSVAAALAGDPRLHLSVAPFPDDDDVAEFLSSCDALIMPYQWGTHSGQLELAFDLGMLPIISDVGYYREQWREFGGLVPEPLWLPWSGTSPFVHGAPLLAAMRRAARGGVDPALAPVEVLREHRRQEHQRTLRAYAEIYGR